MPVNDHLLGMVTDCRAGCGKGQAATRHQQQVAGGSRSAASQARLPMDWAAWLLEQRLMSRQPGRWGAPIGASLHPSASASATTATAQCALAHGPAGRSVVTEAVVRAGGGIVWRRGQGDAVEIVLVHRPAYDDWSFPKGKLHPGETEAQAALREVQEETGLWCRLGREVGTAAYRDPSDDPNRPLLGDDPDRRHPRSGQRDRRRPLGAARGGTGAAHRRA